MAGNHRIAGAGRLTPARTARFTFDGQSYTGLAGDTLASALLANGGHLVGRSSKYHRPRGILSAGAEEPNALVTVERDAARKTPNVRATVQELYDGLKSVSQNRWPSLAFDVGAVNDLASPFFSNTSSGISNLRTLTPALVLAFSAIVIHLTSTGPPWRRRSA